MGRLFVELLHNIEGVSALSCTRLGRRSGPDERLLGGCGWHLLANQCGYDGKLGASRLHA